MNSNHTVCIAGGKKACLTAKDSLMFIIIVIYF